MHPSCDGERINTGGGTEWQGDHGQSGVPISPVGSSTPHIRLAFCTACPAAPLPRLSMAPIAITRLRSGSAAYETKARFEPVAHLVCGGLSLTRTKGRFA